MTPSRLHRSLSVLLLLVVAACGDSAGTGPTLEPSPALAGEGCSDGQACAEGLACVESVCAVEGGSNNGGDVTNNGGDACFDGRERCGAQCCGTGLVCDASQSCARDCGAAVLCGAACCGDGEVCERGECLSACEGERCGASGELCCGGEELCFGQACVVPGAACLGDEQCALDEVCEESLRRCLPRANIAACEYIPPVGDFSPQLGCRWTPEGLTVTPERDDVVATPIVINLTDDNGDDRTDTDDIPDIAFLTYDLEGAGCCNQNATLRIVEGACKPDGTMRTLASLDYPPADNSSGLAAGDLDGDGVPEIIAVGMYGPPTAAGLGRPQGAMAWKRVAANGTRWTLLWENMEQPTWNVHTRGGAIVSIADLYGDGEPEVIIGNVVLNGQTGELVWDGVVTSGGTGGIGNNAFLGPYGTVADIDLDGAPEILAGNTAYTRDGNVKWTWTYTTENSTCGGGLPCDGFTAVANFDDDDEGEVVIVRQGEVFILEHDGQLLWRQPIPLIDCAYNESGPPTIADFDGDGRAEIGTAAADYYVVLDMDCDADPVPAGCAGRGVLWQTTNEDCSSRVTASSVFDFEGDGKAEMIYADETDFRIFDGTTGRVLFDDETHGSHTRIEMPIVADVDNDGNSEVVIPENASNQGTPGVEVWEDASDNWVRTRRIWNQHNYNVTNVNEDGTIPRMPRANWLDPRLNNFRQNVQPSGLFDAPDLTVHSVTADADNCSRTFEVAIAATVANDGALSVSAGVPVVVTASGDGQTWPVANLATTTRLLPGQTERLFFTWFVPMDAWGVELRLTVEIDPQRLINECREENNALTQGAGEAFTCAVIE